MIFASSSNPRALARRVTHAVEHGTIAAWALTSGHLRHVGPAQEPCVGLFKLTVTESAVRFELVTTRRAPSLDAASYAYHHGRLIELLLGHFSDVLTRVHCTPFAGALNA